jgi:hypothetical protein
MKSISALTALLTVLALSVSTTASAQFDEPVQYEEPFIVDQNAPHYEYHLDTGGASLDIGKPGVGYGSILFETNPTGANVFVGDIYQGKTPLLIDNVPDGTYDVRINWTNSETDTFAWTFDGTFEDGKLEYDNAIKTHIVFDEYDRSSTETMYSGGKGSIEVKDGVLTWNDGEEHIADGLRFKAE